MLRTNKVSNSQGFFSSERSSRGGQFALTALWYVMIVGALWLIFSTEIARPLAQTLDGGSPAAQLQPMRPSEKL